MLDAGDSIDGTVSGSAERLANRVRNTVLLGVAIPYVLGFAHVLYGIACFALAALCALAAWRLARRERARVWPSFWLVIPLAAVALAAWPQFVRPPLDGDTLAYHLPNALAWVHAHSIWTTGTRYWWYPGGSELFAAGLITIGARWSVPLAGAVAAAMIALRLTAFGWRSHGVSERSALAALVAPALIAAAFLALPASAFQAGTLQNDVWLAAATLEVLWALLYSPSARATIGAVALCSLVKPTGVVIVAIAAGSYVVARSLAHLLSEGSPLVGKCSPLAGRSSSRTAIGIAGGVLALGLWVVRDVLLAPSAIVPITASSVPNPWGTTIAGAGLRGLHALGEALLAAGLPTLVFAVTPWAAAMGLAVFAALRREVRRFEDSAVAFACIALAGVSASVLYLALPFGFSASVPQLAAASVSAGGGSLRFDLPAMACGAALLAIGAARVPLAAIALGAAAAIAGLVDVQRIFWNDAPTRSTVPAVALGVALLLLALRRRTSLTRGAVYVYVLVLSCVAGALAGGRAVAFYDAGMRAPIMQTPTGVFAILAQLQPRAVVVLDVRAGAVGMLVPGAAVYDDLDRDPCAQARRLDALLVDGTDPDVPAALHERRRSLTLRRCGRVVYEDAAAVIAAPATPPSRTP